MSVPTSRVSAVYGVAALLQLQMKRVMGAMVSRKRALILAAVGIVVAVAVAIIGEEERLAGIVGRTIGRTMTVQLELLVVGRKTLRSWIVLPWEITVVRMLWMHLVEEAHRYSRV